MDLIERRGRNLGSESFVSAKERAVLMPGLVSVLGLAWCALRSDCVHRSDQSTCNSNDVFISQMNSRAKSLDTIIS